MNAKHALWLLALLAAGCRQIPSRADSDPALPTGVHLQAVYEVPEDLEGRLHDEMRYLLYLPEGYRLAADEPRPVIVFLHGSGDAEYESTFVMSFGLPAVLHLGEQPEDFPFIVVSPQAFPGGTWWSEDTLTVLGSLIEDVVEEYNGDPNRVYLTGLSMGGYGAWHLATNFPERFAAMSSISGSGYRTPFLPAKETFCRMSDVPVWAIHGDSDLISDPEASKFNVAALDTCDGEVVWTLYEGEGHISTYERAYRDPALYEWMLSHQRD